jgi:hypothetical protein
VKELVKRVMTLIFINNWCPGNNQRFVEKYSLIIIVCSKFN